MTTANELEPEETPRTPQETEQLADAAELMQIPLMVIDAMVRHPNTLLIKLTHDQRIGIYVAVPNDCVELLGAGENMAEALARMTYSDEINGSAQELEAAARDRRELDARAHSMAYEMCVSHIEGECTGYEDPDGDVETPWYNLASEMTDDERSALKESVDYLEARGLLIHDCMDDNMVRFRDESEATRP